MTSKITIEPMTAETAYAFYGQRPLKTMRGYVAMLDGQPVGIGGLYHERDNLVAFSEMKPEMRTDKRAIARAIRLLMALFVSAGRPVYAVCSNEEETAPGLLSRLGFERTGTTGPDGDVMIFAGGN